MDRFTEFKTKNFHIHFHISMYAEIVTMRLINTFPFFQVLISCGPMDGCHGGDAGVANKWMAENGITDETCSIYVARGHDNGAPCSKVKTRLMAFK